MSKKAPAKTRRRQRAKDPQSRLEWQEAVDAADFALRVDAARSYGLITGGPEFDLARCEQLLEQGRALAIVPTTRCCPE